MNPAILAIVEKLKSRKLAVAVAGLYVVGSDESLDTAVRALCSTAIVVGYLLAEALADVRTGRPAK